MSVRSAEESTDLNYLVDSLVTGKSGASFCSYVADTPEKKAKLFNLTNNPEHRLAEEINKVIPVVDVFCEVVNCTHTNESTGEVTSNLAPRIVLIDDKGHGYTAVSIGIFNCVRRLIGAYGVPHWDNPLKVMPKEIIKGKNRILTLEVTA